MGKHAAVGFTRARVAARNPDLEVASRRLTWQTPRSASSCERPPARPGSYGVRATFTPAWSRRTRPCLLEPAPLSSLCKGWQPYELFLEWQHAAAVGNLSVYLSGNRNPYFALDESDQRSNISCPDPEPEACRPRDPLEPLFHRDGAWLPGAGRTC